MSIIFCPLFMVICRVYCRKVTLMPDYWETEGHATSNYCLAAEILFFILMQITYASFIKKKKKTC